MLYYVSIKETLPSLTFTQAAFAQARDQNVLFVGDLKTACRYLYKNHNLYQVHLTDHTNTFIDGFERYDFLCQQVPEYGDIVFKEGTHWERRSHGKTDAHIFSQLANKLKSTYYGISFTGFQNFHDEIVLFSSAPITSITLDTNTNCQEILDAMKRALDFQSTPIAYKKRRMAPTPTS